MELCFSEEKYSAATGINFEEFLMITEKNQVILRQFTYQKEKLIACLNVGIPILGFIAALYFIQYIKLADIVSLIIMYIVTTLGITVGFHRLFTHKSFETNIIVKVFFLILGSMAAQGSLLFWVASHRKHHQYTDVEGDPHSPVLPGGFYNAHIGWMLNFNYKQRYLIELVPDLVRNRLLLTTNFYYPTWVILGILSPGIFVGLYYHSWEGFISGCFWGGIVRIFIVHQVTWAINSICHLYGTQTFKLGDNSKNNVILGLLGLGEGWHNNHHAFPTSAKHGLFWWQFDFSYYFIKICSWLGLITNIKIPTMQQINKKLENSNGQQNISTLDY